MGLLMSMKKTGDMINQYKFRNILSILSLLYLCACTSVINKPEQNDFIYKINIESEFDPLYDRAYKSLEDSNFYVVRELNIGATMKKNKARWGDDYNKNGFEEVRTLVLCNPWYANEVLNLDPELIALCPLAVAFLHKAGSTTIIYGRRAPIAEASAAHDILNEVDSIIITAIKKAAMGGDQASAALKK